jgi:hypothetical protein
LLYTLEQGPTEKTIIEQCIRQRMPLPDRIKNAPSLNLGLDLFYLAFLELNSCRALGYGSEGPVPWLAIKDFCAFYNIVDEQCEDLFFHVQRLDQAYLEFRNRKTQDKLKQSAATSRAKGKSKK